MRAHLRAGIIDTDTVVDTEGKIVSQETKTASYLAASSEEFFFAYSSLLSLFYTQLSHPEIRVYSYFLRTYRFDAPISVSRALRQEMAKVMSIDKPISAGTISNALSGLVEKKLLFSTYKGLYRMNPRYAFRGSTKERNTMLKVILEYECPDC